VPSKFFSALRIRNFSLVVAAGSMSQLGDRLTHMLLITIIALSNPGKLLAYSASSMVFVLPSMLIAPIAGVLVDRWDKRKVLGYTHIIQSALLFISAFLVIGTSSFVPFWIALFVFFALDVFNNTSVPALIPELVPEGDLLAANSANLTFNRVATVLGMVVGGFLVRWAGWRYGMIINSATHLTAGLLALLITGTYVAHKGIRPASPSSSPSPSKGEGNEGRGTHPAPVGTREMQEPVSLTGLVAKAFRQLFADIAEVVRVVGRSRLVAFVMLSIVVTVFISSVSYTVLIFLVQQVLGLGTGGVGIFAGILAVGMIVGAASLGFVKREVNRPMVVVGTILLYGLLFLASPLLLSSRSSRWSPESHSRGWEWSRTRCCSKRCPTKSGAGYSRRASSSPTPRSCSRPCSSAPSAT
jgi:MFS family permease